MMHLRWLLCGLGLLTLGCKERPAPKGLLYGRDVSGTPVAPGDYEALRAKVKTKPMTISSDPAPSVDGNKLSFSVYATNPAAEALDVYYTVSLAIPGQQALSIRLYGDGIDAPRSPDGPEIYDAIGRIAVTKVVVPGGQTVRFERELSLAPYQYSGRPTANLYWAIALNETPASGTVTVTLPRR